jgi:HEAT repeat protein
VSRARWREVAVAGHVGDVDTARAALTDDDPAVRELALGALERCAALDAATIGASFGDPAHSVRRRAALLAALHPGVSLLVALDDPEATVVEAAAWACGEQVTIDDATLARLIELAGGHDAPLVREAAVAALGAIGDERGLAAILVGCADKPAVRRRAVLALAPFDGDDVVAALRHALTDRDWQVRQAAEDVLGAAGISFDSPTT